MTGPCTLHEKAEGLICSFIGYPPRFLVLCMLMAAVGEIEGAFIYDFVVFKRSETALVLPITYITYPGGNDIEWILHDGVF